MRRRLYFMLPDIEMAKKLERELLLAHIDDSHIHFHATVDAKLAELPKANLLQRTDLLHGMFIGLVVGAVVGSALGYLLYLYPAFGDTLGMGPILGLAIAGAVFGSWASGMVAISMPNSRLKGFQSAIDNGQILLMVDVPKDKVEEITQMIHSHYPEAADKGVESHMPAFP